MKIDELQEMMKIDAVIDNANLAHEATASMALFTKYQAIFYDLTLQCINAKKELDVVKHKTMQYYLGKADDEVYKEKPKQVKVLKSEVDEYIKADDDYIEAEKRYLKLELLVKIVEDYLKQLAGRNYAIKNAIDYIKFQNGV